MAAMQFRPQEVVKGLHGPVPELGRLVTFTVGDCVAFKVDFVGNASFEEAEPDEIVTAAGHSKLDALLLALCSEVAALKRELESVRSRTG